jgi:hypothetical protein
MPIQASSANAKLPRRERSRELGFGSEGNGTKEGSGGRIAVWSFRWDESHVASNVEYVGLVMEPPLPTWN